MRNNRGISTYKAPAWVLRLGTDDTAGPLHREEMEIQAPADDELIIKTLVGSWEGNMDHAYRRDPIDLCVTRNEPRVVIGNAGVVQVEQCGSKVRTVREGDVGMLICNGTPDPDGYPIDIFAYDSAGTAGLLAQRTKIKAHQIIPLPAGTTGLATWAAFSLRFITAWSNWKAAYACWRSQMNKAPEDSFVLSWGGGVGLAEILLARHFGFNVAFIASKPRRLQFLKELDITTFDRSRVHENGATDFLASIRQFTRGRGVDICIDNIGGETTRHTSKIMARQGVIATCGWKAGVTVPCARAIECINRRIWVHTHYASYQEGLESIDFALKNKWRPSFIDPIWQWSEIPLLAEQYSTGQIDDYFPLFYGS
jgi:NADPH:quinone reductase-like Zn-dependent oxidoreductase